jgi:hypothetical protein
MYSVETKLWLASAYIIEPAQVPAMACVAEVWSLEF